MYLRLKINGLNGLKVKTEINLSRCIVQSLGFLTKIRVFYNICFLWFGNSWYKVIVVLFLLTILVSKIFYTEITLRITHNNKPTHVKVCLPYYILDFWEFLPESNHILIENSHATFLFFKNFCIIVTVSCCISLLDPSHIVIEKSE